MPREASRILSKLSSTFSFGDARKAGLTQHAIYSLRAKGLIVPLGAGFYRRADAEQAVDLDLLTAAIRAPKATICLATALAQHELTDAIPGSLDLALPRGTRPPQLESPVSWHFFDPAKFELGRDDVPVEDGISIGRYSPERSIVDAFRLRAVLGPDLGNEALKAWVRRKGSQPAALLKVAHAFPRTEPAIRKALELLL